MSKGRAVRPELAVLLAGDDSGFAALGWLLAGVIDPAEKAALRRAIEPVLHRGQKSYMKQYQTRQRRRDERGRLLPRRPVEQPAF